MLKKRLNKIIISGCLFVIGLILNKFASVNIINLVGKVILIISYIIVGFDILKKAYKNIRKGEVFDENFLMSVATLGAFFIGEVEEAAAVMLFYQ